MNYRDDIFDFMREEALVYINSLPSVNTAYWGKDSLKRLPRSPGLYFCISQSDDVIYIGKSIDLYKRWNSQSHKCYPLLSEIEIYYQEYDEDQIPNLEIDEIAFIAILRPSHNERLGNIKL